MYNYYIGTGNGDIDFGTDGDIRPTFVFVGTPSFPARFITIDVNADNVVEGQEIGLLTIAPSTSFNGFTPRFQSVRIIISDLSTYSECRLQCIYIMS